MAKAAESKPLDLEQEVKPIKEEIKKPNIFLKHWKKKDTPYGNDTTVNFAQAPDSPRYPDEDKGYKSETYVSEKKKKAKIKEPIESKIQRVDDEEAAASYYGDVAQPKVGTRHNDPNTNAGKFFRKQPKEVIQHQEHTTYDPDLAEKWKGRFDPKPQTKLSDIKDTDSFEDKQRKLHEVAVDQDDLFRKVIRNPDPSAEEDSKTGGLIGDQGKVQELLRSNKSRLNKLSQVHLMNVDDESPPAEKGLTVNGDASQAAKSIRPVDKILPLLPMIARIAGSVAGGGEEEEETTKAAPKDLVDRIYTGRVLPNKPKETGYRDSLEQSHAGQSTLAREHPNADTITSYQRQARGGRGKPSRRIPLSVTSDPKSGRGVSGIVDDKGHGKAGRGGEKIRHNPKFSQGKPPTGKRNRDGTMGEELREAIADPTKKSHNSNCPYCNNAGKNKEHDKNPNKFHAWMDSERQKSMLTNTRFMNKIESADPSTVQHEPKKRKPHLDTGKSPFKTPRSKIDEARASDVHNAMPKGQEKIPFKVLTGTAGKPDLINAKDRDDIEPSRTLYGNQKASSIGTPDKEDAPVKDFIAPSTNPKNLPAMYKEPNAKTPDTGDAPNLKPSRGKLGFLKDKNPFKGSNQKPQEDGNMITDAGNIGVKVGGTNPNVMSKMPHGVAAQDISNKSFYSLRTKDGYGSGDLSLQNVIPNTVVNDKETYIGQTATGKHRMIDRNKITNTRIGDDIHYYVNGVEDRGVVVKMGNEYIQIFKEDGNFHDVHINDTFFVKDIVVNKTWDNMGEVERYEALTKIHAPSARFLIKSWNDLPIEIKELLTKKGVGSKIPASSPITPDNSNIPKVPADENTKYFSAYGGKLLGTGTKGRLAQQNEKEPNVNELKSDVEEGTYGNIGSTSNVAPSTSTNLDVSESTGYEERPHISVEEVGSLPRRDAKDNGDDETKEKEDDIKEPKESKDTQKVGVPTGNYNTFGITYAVKANTVWNKKTQRWEQKDG